MVDDLTQVTRRAHQFLQNSGLADEHPTPVDLLLAQAGLTVLPSTTRELLEQAQALGLDVNLIKRTMAHVYGIMDYTQNVVFMNMDVNAERQRFVKLHELGHHILPWQKMIHADTEYTLSDEIKTRYEIEANHFATELLFQGPRFTQDASLLPVEMETVVQLAKIYQASVQASLHRYVVTHTSPCALLVLEAQPTTTPRGSVHPIKQVVTSPAFPSCDPWWDAGDLISVEHEFIRPVREKRKMVRSKTPFVFETHQGICTCEVQVFHNSYRIMVLLVPHSTRTRRIQRQTVTERLPLQ